MLNTLQHLRFLIMSLAYQLGRILAYHHHHAELEEANIKSFM